MTHLLGILFFCAGIGGIIYYWWKEQLVKKSQAWPSTPGRILHSEVRISKSMQGNTPTRTYKSDIKYEYEARGRRLQGSTICIGGELNTSFSQRAEDRCSRYPVGSITTVYYNPENPEQSCLERRGEMALMGYSISGIFTFLGLLLALGVIG